MNIFKRKKPNDIFEFPIDKTELYDACILSTLFDITKKLDEAIFSLFGNGIFIIDHNYDIDNSCDMKIYQ